MNTIEEIVHQLQANNDYQIFVEKILAVASCNFSPSASPSPNSWAPAVSSDDFTSPSSNYPHPQSQAVPHSGYRNCELAFKALQTFEQNIFPLSDGAESIYMTKIQDELPIHQRFMEILTFVSPQQQSQQETESSTSFQDPTERKIYNLTSQLFARVNSIEIKKYHLNAAADAQWMTPASSRQRGSHWATIFADLLGLIETDAYPVRMKKLWLALFHRCCAFIRSNYFTDVDRFANMLRCVGLAHPKLAVSAIGVLSAAIEDCAYVDANGKFPKYQSLGEDILNALDRAVESGDSVTVQEICDRLDDEVDERCVIGDIFVISVPGNSSDGNHHHHVDPNNNNNNDTNNDNNNDTFTPGSKKQKLLNASSINQHRLIEKFFSIVRDKILSVSSQQNSRSLTPSCKIVAIAALKKLIVSLGLYSCYFKNLPPNNHNNNNSSNGSGNKKKKSSKNKNNNNSEKEIPDRSVEMFNWLSNALIKNIDDREKMPDRIGRDQETNSNNVNADNNLLNRNANDDNENVQLQTSLIPSSVNYKTELFVFIAQAIDSLAQSTGGSANLPLGNAVAAFVFANAASAQWQNKVASFRVILHCAEAFRKLYKPQLPVLIEHLLIPRLDDENENFWVRAAACSALSQLSHDFDVIHVCRPYNVALIEKFVRFARSSGDAEVVKNIGVSVSSMIDRLETSLEDEDLEDLVFVKNEEEEEAKTSAENDKSSSDSDGDEDDDPDNSNNKKNQEKTQASVRARVAFERNIRDQYLPLVPIVLENFKPLIEYYLAIFKAGEGAVERNGTDQQLLRQKAEDADTVLQKLCGCISTLSQVLTYKIAPWVKEIAEISVPLLSIRTSAPTTPTNSAFFPFLAFEVLTMTASYCCKKDLDVLVLHNNNNNNNNNNNQKGEPQLVQIIMNFMKMHTSCPEFYIINEMYIENTASSTTSSIKALEKRKEVASHADTIRTSHHFEGTQSKAVGAILRGCTCMSEHLHTPSRLEPYLSIMVPFLVNVGSRLPKQLRCRFEPGTTTGLPECDDRFDYFIEIDNEDGTEYIIKKDEGTWRNVLVASRCVAAILQTSQEGLRNMLIPFIDELTEMQDYLIRSQDEELATSALWAMGQLVSVLNVMKEKEGKKKQAETTISCQDDDQVASATTTTTAAAISQNEADLPALRRRVAAKMALAAAYSIDFSGDSDTINEALSTLREVVPHLDVSALYKPVPPVAPSNSENETSNNLQEENQQEQAKEPEDPKLTHPVYKIYEQLDTLFEIYLHFLSTGGRHDDDDDDDEDEEEEEDDDDDDNDEGQVFGKHFNSLKKKKSTSFDEDDELEENDDDDEGGNEENPFDEIVDRQDDNDEQKSERISNLHYYSGVACDATAVFNELMKIYPPIVLELAKETWPGAVRFLKENKVSEELIVLNKNKNDGDDDDEADEDNEESQISKKKKKSTSKKNKNSDEGGDDDKPKYYKFQQTESAHGCWYILFSPFEQGVFNNSNPEVKNAAMSFINAKVKVAEALPLAVQGLESLRHLPHMLQTIAYNTSSICHLIDMNRRKIRDQQLASSSSSSSSCAQDQNNNLEQIVQTQIEQIEEGKWNFSEVQAKLITFCRDYLSGRMKVGQHFVKSLISKNNSNGKEEEENNTTINKKSKSKKNGNNINKKKVTTNQNANPIDFYLKKETWQSVTCNVVSLATSLVPLLSSESAFTTKRKLVDAILSQLPLKGTDESEKKIVYHRLIDWIMEYNNDYSKRKKQNAEDEDEKLLMLLKDGGILGEDSDNVETVVNAIKFGVSARKRTDKMKVFLEEMANLANE